jgi:hypothetical protein
VMKDQIESIASNIESTEVDWHFKKALTNKANLLQENAKIYDKDIKEMKEKSEKCGSMKCKIFILIVSVLSLIALGFILYQFIFKN